MFDTPDKISQKVNEAKNSQNFQFEKTSACKLHKGNICSICLSPLKQKLLISDNVSDQINNVVETKCKVPYFFINNLKLL